MRDYEQYFHGVCNGKVGPCFTLDFEKEEIRMVPFPIETFLEFCKDSPRIIHPYKDDIRGIDMIFPEWREWLKTIKERENAIHQPKGD